MNRGRRSQDDFLVTPFQLFLPQFSCMGLSLSPAQHSQSTEVLIDRYFSSGETSWLGGAASNKQEPCCGLGQLTVTAAEMHMAARDASRTPNSKRTTLCLAFPSCSQKILSWLMASWDTCARKTGESNVVELKNMHQVDSISSLTERLSWRFGLSRKLTM